MLTIERQEFTGCRLYAIRSTRLSWGRRQQDPLANV